MMLVVDASVAVKFVTREPGTHDAISLLRSPDILIAPDWVLAEVANALCRKVIREEISDATARAAREALPEFFQELYPARDLLAYAVDLAFQLRHALYDCLYLALALRENAVLVTADAKFVDKVARSELARSIELLGDR